MEMFGITFACSGINIAATKVISEELAIGNETTVKRITRKCISISFITGLLASLIFLISSDFIFTTCLHNKVSKNIIYLICLALPFISMSSAISGYFTAIRKAYKNAISRFFEQFVKITATAFILSFLMPSGLEYACYSVILGDVISEIASFVFNYILYRFEKFKESRSISNNSDTFRILRVSMPVAIASYIRSGLSTLKQLLIPSSLERSGMNCSIALSKYGIITGMVMPILMFPCVFVDSFSNLLIPEFSRYYAKNDYNRIRQVTKLILFVISIFSVFLTIVFILFSNDISIFIYKNIETGFYIKMLSPLIIFMYLDIVIDSILKGLDDQFNVMLVNVIDLLVSVIFIYFFVPKLGFSGYVISIYLSELLNFILSFYRLCRLIQNK